jgi:hypothetical protein
MGGWRAKGHDIFVYTRRCVSSRLPNRVGKNGPPDEQRIAPGATNAGLVQQFRDLIPRSPQVRALSLAVALLMFGGGLFLSWRWLAPMELAWWPVLVNAALVPLALAASAWQVRVLARTAGVDPGWWKPFRVVTLGTLSGLLPVSSGTLVRGGAVLYWGATVGKTSRAFAIDFLLWLAASLVLAGAAALWLQHAVIGWSLLLAGLAAFPVSLIVSGAPTDRALWLQLLAARTLGLLVDIPRLAAAFSAVGVVATAAQAAVLTAPAVIASIFFFLPGGLGVREGLTAFLGTAIGLSAAGAFLAAAINRLIALTLIMIWEGSYWLFENVKARLGDPADGPEGS